MAVTRQLSNKNYSYHSSLVAAQPMSRVTHLIVRALQALSRRRRAPKARHLIVGEHGETEAYFYLERLGYRFVAINFRVPRNRGEIDLIGWDKGVLCFVEVKTRIDDSFAPPSTAVTVDKQRHILSVAKRYQQHLPRGAPCRFDILSVVPSKSGGPPEFTLQKGAFTWSRDRRRYERYRDYAKRYSWRDGR